MLTIRVSGTCLKTARILLGWSLQEAAGRSGVNWLTIKKYESADDYHPPASVGALNRLVDALEERPMPAVTAATDAIVRITKTTICGTDLRASGSLAS
jgi:transcriptional regulator with XRE-family HTH domain